MHKQSYLQARKLKPNYNVNSTNAIGIYLHEHFQILEIRETAYGMHFAL